MFGIIGLFTGLNHFGEVRDSEIAEKLTWVLVPWILICLSSSVLGVQGTATAKEREELFGGKLEIGSA